MLPVPEYAAISSDLAVLTCYFNSVGCPRLLANYRRFAAGTRECGVPLFTIECLFDGGVRQFEDDPQALCVTADTRCWQKERLLNLLEPHIPEQYTKLAWVDADILFDNGAWAYDTSDLLDTFALVQMFNTCVWLDSNEQELAKDSSLLGHDTGTGNQFQSFASRLGKTPIGHPGYAWAMRRSIWRECGGLFDRSGSTAADFLMALSAAGTGIDKEHSVAARSDCFLDWSTRFRRLVDGRVAAVGGQIRHLWHGDASSRQYTTLERLLREAGFDPQVDLVQSQSGTWTVPPHRRELVDIFAVYFQMRAVSVG